MARLVQDAAALSDTVDAQSLSFANIVEAIHVVQTNLGITGTTALEASTTISGSLNSMKSAWSNLITGIADDQADFDSLIGNMVDSVGTFAGNIIPRIEVALNGASDLIGKILPTIVDQIPSIVSTVFPKLINSGVQIIQSLIQGISENVELLTTSALEVISTLSLGILNMLPDIIALGLDLLVALATGIVEQLPTLIPAAIECINKIVEILSNPDTLLTLVTAAVTILATLANSLAEQLPTLIPAIVDILLYAVDILTRPETLLPLVDAALAIILGLAEGLIKSIPSLVAKLPTIIFNIVDFLIFDGVPALISAGGDLLDGLFKGLLDPVQIVKNIASFGDSIVNGIKDFFGIHSPSTLFRDEVGKMLVKGIGVGFDKEMPSLEKSINKDLLNLENGLNTDFAINATAIGSGSGAFGGVSGKSVNVVQNIYSEAKSAADLMLEALYQQEMAVMMGV